MLGFTETESMTDFISASSIVHLKENSISSFNDEIVILYEN